MIPYSGNSAYCFSNSLRMCLESAGMADVPDVGVIESLTGMPFGATFLDLQSPVFFPSPASIDPDKGVNQAIASLGWQCSMERHQERQCAEDSLRRTVAEGPALVGPLDMGGLSYDPERQRKQGGDHFVVVTAIEDDWVELHDPQLFPCATLSLQDFVSTWNASRLGYTDYAYTLRSGFNNVENLSLEDVLARHLDVVRRLMAHKPEAEAEIVYSGSDAFDKLAQQVQNGPSDDFANSLVKFSFPLGARRCLDGANYLQRCGRKIASELMKQKAKIFGIAQYSAVAEDWNRVAEKVKSLSALEREIAELV